MVSVFEEGEDKAKKVSIDKLEITSLVIGFSI